MKLLKSLIACLLLASLLFTGSADAQRNAVLLDHSRIYALSHGGLANALTHFGAQTATIIVTEPEPFEVNTTIPSNILLEFSCGFITCGRIDPASGVTVTINSSGKNWPLRQIFGGSGTIAYGVGVSNEIRTEWRGTKWDGSTDDTTAIQKTIDEAGLIPVVMPAGSTVTSAALTIGTGQSLIGAGGELTIITNTTTDGLTRKTTMDSVRSFVTLKGFTIVGPTGGANTLNGFFFEGFTYSHFEDLTSKNHQTGFNFSRSAAGTLPNWFNESISLRGFNNKTGISLTDVVAGGTAPNANVFYDSLMESVSGQWSGMNMYDISGNGNRFYGLYGGTSSANSIVKIRQFSNHNEFYGLYGEGSATYLIDNSIGVSQRKNWFFGVHLDSVSMVLRANTADKDTIIFSESGFNGSSLNSAATANVNGIKFDGITIDANEPELTIDSSNASGKKWRILSGGGAEIGAGSFGIRNDDDALNVLVTTSAGVTTLLGLKIDVVATGSLPAAGAANDGRVLIEDVAAGDRNLIIYAGGQRFRIDGGAAF